MVRPDVLSHGGYGARPKTTGLARQTESVWAEAGPTKLQPGSGVPSRDSSAAEVGYRQPAHLGQPSQTSGVHAYPPPSLDVPSGSTSAQSPVLYWEQLTGRWVRDPNVAFGLSPFHSTPDGRLEGFIAEARGTCQSTKVVDVSQCVSGASGPPPA